jgi:hypothetical protein
MKTANKYIDIFNTLEGATSAFHRHRSARLLVATSLTGKGDYFVDITPEYDHRPEVAWPNKYKILKENK